MTSLTLRPQTPPAALTCFPDGWLPCVMTDVNGANTPDRSVSTPSEIVVSVTPGPVLMLAAPPPPDPPELLLLLLPLSPQAVSTRAQQSAETDAAFFHFIAGFPLPIAWSDSSCQAGQ